MSDARFRVHLEADPPQRRSDGEWSVYAKTACGEEVTWTRVTRGTANPRIINCPDCRRRLTPAAAAALAKAKEEAIVQRPASAEGGGRG